MNMINFTVHQSFIELCFDAVEWIPTLYFHINHTFYRVLRYQISYNGQKGNIANREPFNQIYIYLHWFIYTDRKIFNLPNGHHSQSTRKKDSISWHTRYTQHHRTYICIVILVAPSAYPYTRACSDQIVLSSLRYKHTYTHTCKHGLASLCINTQRREWANTKTDARRVSIVVELVVVVVVVLTYSSEEHRRRSLRQGVTWWQGGGCCQQRDQRFGRERGQGGP